MCDLLLNHGLMDIAEGLVSDHSMLVTMVNCSDIELDMPCVNADIGATSYRTAREVNGHPVNQETLLVFIDFMKAFDCIEHDFLMHKLINLGITGDIYSAIRSFYHSLMSCVRVGGHYTDWFPITSGIRHGDSLSPVLFSIFIDDLAEKVRELNSGVLLGGLQIRVLSYADDVVLMAPCKEDCQNQLWALHEWCTQLWMSINPSKSKALHIHNHQRPRCQDSLKCGNDSIVIGESYKYLGIFFHEYLSFDTNVEALTSFISK